MVLNGYGIGGPGSRGRYRAMKAGMVSEGMELRMSDAPAPSAMAMDAVEESRAEGEIGQNLQRSDKDVEAGGGEPESSVELRSDFSETAFWEPHVVLEPDGSATVEFDVPDSVTDWNLWVHAVTTDLRGGSTIRQAQSVKELMVRPYLPRFLREGDRAVLKVVVNNAGEEAFEGALNLAINDPVTGEDLRSLFGLTPEQTSGVPFSVEAGKGADLSFPLAVPARVGTVAFKITARAGQFSDGELRPLPVLPGRMHLMQSRFVTLHDADRREMHFADMAAQDDPTLINDQLVVTLDAQLFYSVLNALPYLVNYPYECTEQTLNRFLSTGIVSSLFDQYPSVERMAAKLSARETRYETWQADDPNRAMELVETPWLQTARGGSEAAGRSDQRPRPHDHPRPARRRPCQTHQEPDLARRLPLVPGRPAVAVDDPLHPQRLLQGSRVRRRRPQGRGGAGVGLHAPPLHRGVGRLDDGPRLLLGDHHVLELRALELPRRVVDRRRLHRRRTAADARLQLPPLARPLASDQGLSRSDSGAGGPPRRRGAGLRCGDGFVKDRPGPRHLLGARGPGLALVQRHHRDPRLRPAGADRARTRRRPPPRSGPLAAA